MEPTPGSSVQARLKAFEGFWVYTGRLEGAEFGVAGPNTHTEKCELIGDRFVASRYEVNAPTGSYSGVGIVGYDLERSEFTFTSYDSRGVVTNLRAPMHESRYVWAVGHTTRIIWEPQCAHSYAFRIEAREPDGAWRVVDEGRYDKVRAR